MIANKSERVNCPFNPVHVIERRRLQAHIIKCRRNLPPNHGFVECPFWYNHYVQSYELEEHMLHCEHRLLKEANKRMWENVEAVNKFNEPELIADVLGSVGYHRHHQESWDDAVYPAFKAEKLISTTTHMIVPQGMTKSQRKEFKESERLRLRDLEDKRVPIVKTEASLPDMPAPVPDVKPRKPEFSAKTKTISGPSRIAAKFPARATAETAENERSCGASTSSTYYSACGSIVDDARVQSPSVGRGRGALGTGWTPQLRGYE